jgi:hypothetical protein
MLTSEENQVKKKSKEGPPVMESNPGQKPIFSSASVINDNSSDFPPLPGSNSGNSSKFAGSNIFTSLAPDGIVDPFNDNMSDDDGDDNIDNNNGDINKDVMNVSANSYDHDDKLLKEISNVNYFNMNELDNNNDLSNNSNYGDSQSSLLSNNGFINDTNWLTSRSTNSNNSNQIPSFMSNTPVFASNILPPPPAVFESTILPPPPGLGPPPGLVKPNINTNSTYETNLFQNNIFNNNNNNLFNNNNQVNNDMKIDDIIDDDDDFDDVVVFRPAFSRVDQLSPKIDTNMTNTMPFSTSNSSIFSDLKNICNSNSNNSISSMTDFGLNIISNDNWNQSMSLLLGNDEINNNNNINIEKRNNGNESNINEFDQEPWWKKT